MLHGAGVRITGSDAHESGAVEHLRAAGGPGDHRPPAGERGGARTACHDAQVEEACAKAKIQVMGGHTEVTAVVNQPVISVCGVGKVKDAV